MAKGMVESPGWSRLTMPKGSMSPKEGLLFGGATLVGEGRTSVRREGGSLRDSLFQIAFPQVKALAAGVGRLVPEDEGVGQVEDSVRGVLGCELVDEKELGPAKELFRCGSI